MLQTKSDPRDALFSKMIRERDGNKCKFCPKKSPDYVMTNSHFWGRGHKATRFDTENCDTLCFLCHQANEGSKQGNYRTWKIKQLGKEKYEALERLHNTTKKYGEFEKKALMKILKEQYANKEHLKKGWQVVW